MTHRERILATLQHKEPDRVPVDLGATESSGIMGVAYNRLKKHLGLSGKTQIYDIMSMTAKVEPCVLEIVGSDAAPLFMEPEQWKPWTLSDGSQAQVPAGANLKRLDSGEIVELAADGTILNRCPAGGQYLDPVFWPLANVETVDDIDANDHFIKSFGWMKTFDEDVDHLRKRAKRLYEETDYAIVGNLCVHVFLAGQLLRGFENFFMDLLTNKPLVHRMLDKLLETYLARVDKYIEAVGPYVDIILVNDDLGAQQGPQISVELYREMIKPYHKQLWGHIKQKSQKPLLLHSCGSVYEFIPDFIEMGVDALNPIQISAANMDTKKLKQEFGKDITFWGGGCDTQKVLCWGTPDDVKAEVRKQTDELAPGGGFVFTQVHNIQYDVPAENILAMYEELGTLTL